MCTLIFKYEPDSQTPLVIAANRDEFYERPTKGIHWWEDDKAAAKYNTVLEDLYLFGHGHDYKAALRDYSSVGGRIPLLPRYALGVWFSRWYDYSPTDVLTDVVEAYEERSLPLDVLVLDMNWHTKHNWTGYTLIRDCIMIREIVVMSVLWRISWTI